jgi:hypothetical protein
MQSSRDGMRTEVLLWEGYFGIALPLEGKSTSRLSSVRAQKASGRHVNLHRRY